MAGAFRVPRPIIRGDEPPVWQKAWVNDQMKKKETEITVNSVKLYTPYYEDVHDYGVASTAYGVEERRLRKTSKFLRKSWHRAPAPLPPTSSGR